MLRRNPFPVILYASLLVSLHPPTASGAQLTVENLVANVLANHPELGFYQAEIDAARAGQRGSTAWADPELSVDLGRKRVSGLGGLVTGEGAAWAVSLSQTFEWPGRGSLRKAIADQDLILAELGLEQFRATLESQVRELAFGLAAARDQTAAATEVADRIRSLRDVLLSREPSGINPLLEIRAIESAELVLQRRATNALLAANAALLELNLLRGAKLDAPVELAPIELEFSVPPTPATIATEAADHNFTLRARQIELRRHESVERLAHSDRYPSFTVAPFYAQATAINRETTFGVGLSVPLPVSGRRQAKAAGASARTGQVAAALASGKLSIERDVFLAATTYSARWQEVERWSSDAIARFREAAEQADKHFRQGAVPLATYIALQTAYLDAVDTLAATRRETIAAAFDLERLCGSRLNLVSTR